jgi:acyl-CoA thioester hydrolase
MTKLIEKDDYSFKYEVQVRIGDLNYGGHLGAAEMVSIIHDSRVHFFKSMEIAEINLGDGKTAMVIKDLVVNFRGEAFLDDVLIIGVDAEVEKDDEFRIYYRIKTKKRLVALAETGVVSFNMLERKKRILPPEFYKALQA